MMWKTTVPPVIVAIVDSGAPGNVTEVRQASCSCAGSAHASRAHTIAVDLRIDHAIG
jgi:hypothetical protein